MAGIDHWAAEAFTAEEFEDPFDPGPTVSIRSLKSAVKRRKRLWIATAFAGLILGASLHVLLPSKVAAVSRLYLIQPAGADPTIAITNDLNLLGTRTVAVAASGVLQSGATQPLTSYKGSAQGSALLAIKATGPTGTEAAARANAVAKAFLQVRAQVQKQATDAEITTLSAEIQSRQADMASSRNAAQQSQDRYQIGIFQDQIAQDKAGQSAVVRNSVVLDPAYVVVVSAKKTAIKDGLAGLIAGLALGITIVILGELLSDRVRGRSDVASALGAPVELSVGRLK